MSEGAMRASLWAAAVFNFVAAYAFAVPHSTLARQVGLPVNVPALHLVFVAYFVALFGIVYGWLAQRSPIDRPMLALGACGKLGAFSLALVMWLADAVTLEILVVSLGDLTFAAWWFSWLRHAAEQQDPRQQAPRRTAGSFIDETRTTCGKPTPPCA